MKDQLVSLEVAKIAKSKGFDIQTEFYWLVNDKIGLCKEWSGMPPYIPDGCENVYRPTQSLLQKWLRSRLVYIKIELCYIGSDEWDYGYFIQFLPKERHNEKRRVPYFQQIESFQEGIGSYIGAWSTYEQALEEGLKKGLELC